MVNKTDTISKKSSSIIWIILIGALGSGLWEILLKDILFYIGGVFVDIVSHFHRDYINSLYENVGKAESSTILTLPGILIVILIIFTPILIYIWSSRIWRNINEKNKEIHITKFKKKFLIFISKSKTRFTGFLVLLFIPTSILYTDLFIKDVSNIRATNYIDRSIEIIRPYINEDEYLILRSEYRQIDDLNKFQNILTKLTTLSSNNKIKLPTTEFYGIEIQNKK